MKAREISRYRLANQQIAVCRHRTPGEVVRALGAMQAQDYPGSLWAVGLRLPGVTESDVERAIAGRTIVRTWALRGTLHLVAAEDVRWMLELLAPRILPGSKGRWKQLELDEATFSRSRKLLVRALEGNRQLERDALVELLAREGIRMNGQRAYHIFWRLAREGTLCFGARAGRQPTFALLDEWVPKARKLDRDAARAELARRYFTSHGPATFEDFAGWSGLTMSDARAGLADAGSRLIRETVAGTVYWLGGDLPSATGGARGVHLLPGFDEYVLGYKDRSAILEPQHAQKIVPGGNGVFHPTVVIQGKVAGTWKRRVTSKEVMLTISPFSRFSQSDRRGIAAAAERYGQFLGLPVRVSDG